MIVIGVLLTSLFIAPIWITNSVWNIVFNFIATVGIGIFCSAIVSLCVENENEKILRTMRIDQRKYILSSFENRLKGILIFELRSLSSYYLFSDNNKKKTNKYSLTAAEQIEKISYFLNEISSSTATVNQLDTVFNSNYLQKIGEMRNLAYKNNSPYYQDLLRIVDSIIASSNSYYIGGILDKEQIKAIEEIQGYIISIANSSNEDDLELMFEFKALFYKDIGNYLKKLEIATNDVHDCYIREVVQS